MASENKPTRGKGGRFPGLSSTAEDASSFTPVGPMDPDKAMTEAVASAKAGIAFRENLDAAAANIKQVAMDNNDTVLGLAVESVTPANINDIVDQLNNSDSSDKESEYFKESVRLLSQLSLQGKILNNAILGGDVDTMEVMSDMLRELRDMNETQEEGQDPLDELNERNKRNEEKTKSLRERAGDFVEGSVEGANNALQQAASVGAADAIFGAGTSEMFSALSNGIAALTAVMGSLTASAVLLPLAIGAVVLGAVYLINQNWQEFKGWLQSVWDFLPNSIKDVLQAWWEGFTDVWFGDNGTFFERFMRNVGTPILEGLRYVGDMVSHMFGQALNAVGGLFGMDDLGENFLRERFMESPENKEEDFQVRDTKAIESVLNSTGASPSEAISTIEQVQSTERQVQVVQVPVPMSSPQPQPQIMSSSETQPMRLSSNIGDVHLVAMQQLSEI